MKTTNKKTLKIDKKIIAYVRTAIISLFFVSIAVIISLFISFQNVETQMKMKKAENEKIEYYMVGLMIEEYKHLGKIYPYEYRINERLGYLYMIYKEYDKSEQSYKAAISKAPNGVYEPYKSLALLYIRLERYEDAEKLMNSLSDKPIDTLIGFKGEVFRKIGDKYYQKGYYYIAAKKFEHALFYYTKMKKPSQKIIIEIKDAIATCYIDLADMFLSENKYTQTTKMLEYAEKYRPDSRTVRYKRALALIDSNPETAAELFDELFTEDPVNTNFYVYYNLLKNLVTKYYNEGKYSEAKLYKYKAEKITDFVQDNIIYPKEVILEPIEATVTYKKKKNDLKFKFKVRNLSRLDLNKLHVSIIFKKNNEPIYQFDQELFDGLSGLSMHEETPLIDVTVEKPLKLKRNETPNYTADVVLYKNPNYKAPVQTIRLNFIKQ